MEPVQDNWCVAAWLSGKGQGHFYWAATSALGPAPLSALGSLIPKACWVCSPVDPHPCVGLGSGGFPGLSAAPGSASNKQWSLGIDFTHSGFLLCAWKGLWDPMHSSILWHFSLQTVSYFFCNPWEAGLSFASTCCYKDLAWPPIALLDEYTQRKWGWGSPGDVRASQFIASLFAAVKGWKQPLSVKGWNE